MSDVFTIKRTNQLPSQEITLSSGATFDLSVASSVSFCYRPSGTTTPRSIIAAVITDAPGKKIRIDWGSADVASLGQYEFQVEVVIASKVMSFPTKGFYTFSVTPTLEP